MGTMMSDITLNSRCKIGKRQSDYISKPFLEPGQHLDIICLKAFTKDDRLCIVKFFSEYLNRTGHLRLEEKLLISTVKPHKSVSKSTVS